MDCSYSPISVPAVSRSTTQGGAKIVKFIHSVPGPAVFGSPLTGVKRKLTFYDLKCEFYRCCAVGNGKVVHKQWERVGVESVAA